MLVNQVNVALPELAGRLERMLNARKDRVLYMDGANEAPYGVLLEAMDHAREGGASPVVLLTKAI